MARWMRARRRAAAIRSATARVDTTLMQCFSWCVRCVLVAVTPCWLLRILLLRLLLLLHHRCSICCACCSSLLLLLLLRLRSAAVCCCWCCPLPPASLLLGNRSDRRRPQEEQQPHCPQLAERLCAPAREGKHHTEATLGMQPREHTRIACDLSSASDRHSSLVLHVHVRSFIASWRAALTRSSTRSC